MLIVGDFFAILSAFVIAYILRVTIDTRPLVAEITSEQYLRIFLILLPFWLIAFASLNLYRKEVYEYRLPETWRLLIGSFIGILLLLGYEFVSQETVFPARLVALYGFIGSFILLLVSRTILRRLRRVLYKYGVGVQNVMIIGSTNATSRLANFLHNPKTSGYFVKAIVGRKEMLPEDFGGEHYSNLKEALENAEKLGINTIVQTEFYEDRARNTKVLHFAQENHLAYRFIPTQSEFFTGNHSVELFHGFPVIAVHQTRMLGWQKVLKRAFDVGVSLLTLPFLLVFYIVFGIIIKITDPSGPIFYRPIRVTRFGYQFKTYKFRTMYWKYSTKGKGKTDEQILREMGHEDLAELVAKGDVQIANDPRVMPIGKFLRATSLDEFPQFLNALRGHMSIVGPRAITPRDMKLYKEKGSLLLHVKTGITGLAQVSGRSNLSYEERTRLNLYYVQNWSFMLDIRIILRTILVVLRGQDSK